MQEKSWSLKDFSTPTNRDIKTSPGGREMQGEVNTYSIWLLSLLINAGPNAQVSASIMGDTFAYVGTGMVFHQPKAKATSTNTYLRGREWWLVSIVNKT